MKSNTVLIFVLWTVFVLGIAPVAAQNSGFGPEKTSWHGYDRFAVGPQDPKPVVDFIVSKTQ